MKPTINFSLSLVMVLFMATSCVSSPPSASPEPQAGNHAEPIAQTMEASTAEAPAETPTETPTVPAAGPELNTKVPENATETSVAVVDGISGEQTLQAAQSADPQPAPVAVNPSSVPTVTSTSSVPITPSPSSSPSSVPTTVHTTKPSSVPTKPLTPANPPPQTATASQEKPRQIGEVVYTEGKVSVHRAGKTITMLDIGDVVYAYDVVMTGPASLAQVDLGSGRAGGAFIRLSGNTAFYFDTKELSAEQRRTVLQLLSGSIAVKVEKLAGGSFSVASDTAILGVRGTEFVIDTIPDGSILVSCVEGAVAIQGSEGQTATAQPGRAVKSREAELETADVTVSELARFRSGWRQDSFANFARQAVQYSSGYAATLDNRRGPFDSALVSLRSQEATLRLWREAKASGKEPRFTEWTAEKKAMGGVLLESLKALFIIERPYYRLLELKSLHDSGTGVGTLQDGRSTTEFFNQFDSRYGSLADGMASVREALLLFAWASAGSPLGEFFGTKAESFGIGALFLGGNDW